MITVRDATEADLDFIVELAHRRRLQYAGYQPVFWRPAGNARDLHRLFFNAVLSKDPGMNSSIHGHCIYQAICNRNEARVGGGEGAIRTASLTC